MSPLDTVAILSSMTMDYTYEISQLLALWRPVLNLDHWDIKVSFDEIQSIASCQASPQYLTAVLSFNLARLSKEIATRPELEELVLHELVHARLWALANVLPDVATIPGRFLEHFEEEAVSQITLALLKARYHDQKRESSEVRYVEMVESRTEATGPGQSQPVSPGVYQRATVDAGDC